MTDFSYIGFNDKDEAVAICIDDPKFKRDTAKTVAEWIRMGRRVERMEHVAACTRLKSDWSKRATTEHS